MISKILKIRDLLAFSELNCDLGTTMQIFSSSERGRPQRARCDLGGLGFGSSE